MKNDRVDLNFLIIVKLFELVTRDKKTVKRMNGTLKSCCVARVMKTSENYE